VADAVPQLTAEQFAEKIARGHAFQKHVVEQSEFPGITREDEFSKFIARILMNPTERKKLSRGRNACWDESTHTVVITDPKSPETGTAFKPKGGKGYFEGLK
jgi:filamentous hemagglutinin